ncbi:hypothetical protein M6B38_348595 [Iris pallida]|uniref:Uncharacterized protein n=1 Tax=Iris pallida TaxID=29817 RepID=A0AAX6GT96_IRIPA|nr:hypothetical protein M6B38_348595 [Iris pallida]
MIVDNLVAHRARAPKPYRTDCTIILLYLLSRSHVNYDFQTTIIPRYFIVIPSLLHLHCIYMISH